MAQGARVIQKASKAVVRSTEMVRAVNGMADCSGGVGRPFVILPAILLARKLDDLYFARKRIN
jgi:hypothetical protein